jgi:hypothetical protein
MSKVCSVRFSSLLAALLLGLSALACGDSAAPDPEIPTLNDVLSAPDAIRRAAAAVVLVRTQRASGTASFISRTGLMMTNNHVLGAEVCPVEGCWVHLVFAHQRGEARQKPRTLFAVPKHVDVGLDMAVLQVFEEDGRTRLDTPDYLTFSEKSAANLIGEHITIVGHPNARLKKWSDGVVLDAHGAWFFATNYILPGDSGSPVLNDRGEIVGLIHRSSPDDANFTMHGVNTVSIGTASEPLAQALKAQLPPVMISVRAPTTAPEVVAHNLVYLTARRQHASIEGASIDVVSLLGEACDEALARQDIRSVEQFDEALAPCWDAIHWIECRQDADDPDPATLCPDDDARAAWSGRYQMLNQKNRGLNGRLDLYSISYGVAALEYTEDEGMYEAGSSLRAALTSAHSLLDFDAAVYLAAFDTKVEEVRTLIENYQRVPGYANFALDIAASALWLTANYELPSKRAFEIMSSLAKNPDVAMDARLYIEEVQYTWGRL